MVTSTCNQPQISVKDQIELLKSDGLIFQDEERARHLLENVSMFRMKNYLNPFRQRGNRRFRKNTTFDDVYKINNIQKRYCKNLRKCNFMSKFF